MAETSRLNKFPSFLFLAKHIHFVENFQVIRMASHDRRSERRKACNILFVVIHEDTSRCEIVLGWPHNLQRWRQNKMTHVENSCSGNTDRIKVKGRKCEAFVND
ncbi:hypothetical protein KIN20_004187 [Parelaphostrongylus tenuis]|uniref:Uncharacterized protein n=1 Tax=Parelaphostrongylus tenuis TaxID=148309 RepID=A0AAD5MQZ1_PARTN|nr:hypothetical protein KIN20_004187 [Parelaphostrongylus tenuis]